MKKSTVKLKLSRETIRTLEQSQLEGVDGGATLGSACVGSCIGCTGRTTCLC